MDIVECERVHLVADAFQNLLFLLPVPQAGIIIGLYRHLCHHGCQRVGLVVVVDAHHASVTDGAVQGDGSRGTLELNVLVVFSLELDGHFNLVSGTYNHPEPGVYLHQARLFQFHLELHQLVVLERELLVVRCVVYKLKIDHLAGISDSGCLDFRCFLGLYACTEQAYKHTNQYFLHLRIISFCRFSIGS